MTLKFVTLKTTHKDSNGNNEDRNVTIAYEKYMAYLLGGVAHNTTLIIDQELVDNLQKLVNFQNGKE